jgi:hypothetical protein
MKTNRGLHISATIYCSLFQGLIDRAYFQIQWVSGDMQHIYKQLSKFAEQVMSSCSSVELGDARFSNVCHFRLNVYCFVINAACFERLFCNLCRCIAVTGHDENITRRMIRSKAQFFLSWVSSLPRQAWGFLTCFFFFFNDHRQNVWEI